MTDKNILKTGTSRLEAFSDGVIAIIITLMILEIKLPPLVDAATSYEVWHALTEMIPHLLAYVLSFVVLGIMWANHHQVFHSIQHSDSKLLWYNLHLLFWMSLIPLPTAFLGEHHHLPQATMFYGAIMFMNAFSFALLRWYAQDKAGLYHDNYSQRLRVFYRRLNIFSSSLYFISIFAGFVSVYISLFIFVLIPLIYFLPKPIELETKN